MGLACVIVLYLLCGWIIIADEFTYNLHFSVVADWGGGVDFV